jgi:SpoVK/Ycf46/Vps4 family AAA+-type ATPase
VPPKPAVLAALEQIKTGSNSMRTFVSLGEPVRAFIDRVVRVAKWSADARAGSTRESQPLPVIVLVGEPDSGQMMLADALRTSLHEFKAIPKNAADLDVGQRIYDSIKDEAVGRKLVAEFADTCVDKKKVYLIRKFDDIAPNDICFDAAAQGLQQIAGNREAQSVLIICCTEAFHKKLKSAAPGAISDTFTYRMPTFGDGGARAALFDSLAMEGGVVLTPPARIRLIEYAGACIDSGSVRGGEAVVSALDIATRAAVVRGSSSFDGRVQVDMPDLSDLVMPTAGTDGKSKEQLLKELDDMIGLEAVKIQVKKLNNELAVDAQRKASGLKVGVRSRHLVFTGNPGTAKTTVARLIAQIYKAVGLIKRGHLVEVQRSDLVAGYVGQTAPMTRKACERAMGGVLFIDEAYQLAPLDDDDFGPEAIAELLTQMENHRDELIVIAAGYPKEMDRFLDSNPGLRSRFASRIEFPDYSNDELARIFQVMAKSEGYQLAPDLVTALPGRMARVGRGKGFANGRSARAVLEASLSNQSTRLAGVSNPDSAMLSQLVLADLPAPSSMGAGQTDDAGPQRGLDELMTELDGMIGLDAVKQQVRSISEQVAVDSRRRTAGMKISTRSRHLVFTGNPGTAKTTVARLIAQIFRELGVLSSGHLVETTRTDLVVGYIGQTAPKTREVCAKALGGVLFIDEAYQLASDYSDDFGPEAIAELLVQMEDHRDDMIVIAAGYPKDMDHFLDANEGLRSRFANRIEFPDYSNDELVRIFQAMAKSQGYDLAPDLVSALPARMARIGRGKGFANGRSARGVLEGALAAQSSRLAKNPDVPDSELSKLVVADLPAPGGGAGQTDDAGPRRGLDDLMTELDAMIGLNSVKQQVHSITAETKIDARRRAAGMKVGTRSRHLVFTGNPGTAKTTVARLMAQIYRELGVLSSGHLVETGRPDFVSEHVGGTAPKTRELCAKALGGVLFVDEAYQLAQDDDEFGKEAVAELLVQMENHRDDMIVIAAGYPEDMDRFLDANEGLRSRFASRVEFPDYSNDELARIFQAMAKSQGYDLAPDLVSALPSRMARIGRGKGFANGRSARGLLETAQSAQSVRLSNTPDADDAALNQLTMADLPAPGAGVGQTDDAGPRRGLDELMAELDTMIGLTDVKQQVRAITAETRVDARRRSAGLKVGARSRHLIFTGNPGTAKTTVARLIAQIYRELGVLSSGHLVETGRPDFVGEYIGQTAPKTRAVCERAMGGVLFVDEAYDLVSDGGNDYGKEAVAELLVQMENHRDDLIVIAAGYPKDMDHFLDANEGLRSRFGTTINFPDYSDEDLDGIFRVMADGQGYHLEDALAAVLPGVIGRIDRGKGFANGRSARRLLEQMIERQSTRLAGPDVDLDSLPDDELTLITVADIPPGFEPSPAAPPAAPPAVPPVGPPSVRPLPAKPRQGRPRTPAPSGPPGSSGPISGTLPPEHFTPQPEEPPAPQPEPEDATTVVSREDINPDATMVVKRPAADT